MCGIAGYLVSKDEDEFSVRGLARDLLLEIEVRGRDATGAAWFDGDTVMVQKDALPAKQFVPNLELPPTARNVILHTRFGTKGSEYNNANNHPVITGGIVGVHNGGVWNDDSLFNRMGLQEKRIGQVDTEAIFAAIAYGTEINPGTGKPRLGCQLLDVLGEVTGSAAIAWLEIGGSPDVMQLARISSSPLVWGQTRKGTFVFASTKEAIERACKKNDLTIVHWDIASEGDYMLVRDGRVDEFQKFEPAKSWTSHSHSSTWSYDKDSHTYKKDEDEKNIPKGSGQITTPRYGSPPARTSDATWVSPVNMYGKLCKLLAEDIAEASTQFHYGWWKAREDSIDKFLASIDDTEQPGMSMREAASRHAFVRQGTWVLTDLGTYTGLRAQVYGMPQTFPGGSYLLRILIPNDRYATGYEPVLVERQAHEFTVIRNPEEAQSPETQPEIVEHDGAPVTL